jgi:hypothetical protein
MPNNKTSIVFVVAAVVFGSLSMPSPAFAASSEQVLYSFCSLSGLSDGEQPTCRHDFGQARGTCTAQRTKAIYTVTVRINETGSADWYLFLEDHRNKWRFERFH